MIDLQKAYQKANKIMKKDVECIDHKLYFYVELDECYAFLSAVDEFSNDGKMFVVNKVGGKTVAMNHFVFMHTYDEYDSDNLIEIKNGVLSSPPKEKDKLSSILDVNHSLDFSERDLIFNLVDNDLVSYRTLLNVDEEGITIDNITKMSLLDFAEAHGQKRENLYNSILDLSKNVERNLNNISIYALLKRDVTKAMCDKLFESGIDKIYKLALLPEGIASRYVGDVSEKKIDEIFEAYEKGHFELKLDEKTSKYVLEIEKNSEYIKCLKLSIQTLISKENDGIKPHILKKKIEPKFVQSSLIDIAIKEMIDKKTIRFNENGLIANELKLIDFISYLPSSEITTIFTKFYLEGLTGEVIGKEYGVSRERIRQKLKKIVIPELYEDRYFDFFKEYAVEKEQFCALFNVEPYIYHYVMARNRSNKGKKDIENLLDDESLPMWFKQNLEKLFKDKFYFIDGTRVSNSKKALLNYYFKHNVHELTKLEDITEGFKSFVQNNASNYEKGLDKRDVEGTITRDDFPALKSLRNSFKYFDITDPELDRLINELNLKQYEDIELSSLYLFELHKDLMDEFNIEDEYVLHNLLRKICNIDGIDFQRSPFISFGDGNRNKQLDDLVIEMAPVKLADFLREYRTRYGAKENFMASVVTDKYNEIIEFGTIKLDNSLNVSEEEIVNVKEILKEKEFWFKEDINEELKRSNISKPESLYTGPILDKLGFCGNSNYIFSNKYESMKDYLQKKYFDKDYLDCADHDRRMNYIVLFNEMLNSKRCNLEIIEFENRKFINTNVLLKAGVKLEDLKDFVSKVDDFTVGKGIFTIKSIVNNGFEHKLFDLGFDDIFYESLLRSNSNLKFKRIQNKATLFENTNENKSISVIEIIEEVLFRYRKMDAYDLAEYIADQYGIDYTNDLFSLRLYTKGTDIFYSPLEIYYYNYNVYEEVINNEFI